MTKIYYAAAKKKTQGHNAGAIFKVWRQANGTVYAIKQNFGNETVTMKAITIDVGQPIAYSVEMARRTFTRPSTDIESVIEESIEICESTYC